MNNNLIQKIVELTYKDKKTLVERALKTCEEAGELAGAVLSYTGTASCVYKGKTLEDVTEELADIIICALSVSIQAGISLEQLEKTIDIKAEKWAEIIKIEDKL